MILKHLLGTPGIIVDQPNKGGETALDVARANNHETVIRMLEHLVAIPQFYVFTIYGSLYFVLAGSNTRPR